MQGNFYYDVFKSRIPELSLIFFLLARIIPEEGLYGCLCPSLFPSVAFLACVFLLNFCSWGELGLCVIMCVK